MRFAQIKNGVVVNVIEADDAKFLPNLVQSNTAGPGYAYDGKTFTQPQEVIVPVKPTLEARVAALETAVLTGDKTGVQTLTAKL